MAGTNAATKNESVLLNISEMIDLAIGTPENGVVDFCMLQTILHCLAQQMRVLGKNVELRGDVASLPVPGSRENQQTIVINEYIVETDGKEPSEEPQLVEPVPPPQVADKETMLVVERRKRSSELSVVTSPTRARSPPSRRVPQTMTSTEKLSLVTISKFNILENTVDDLKSRVYGSMPKNQEILEEVRSQTNLKAITDMWTSLNVSSRLEAAETGLTKLSSLVQDLISDTVNLQDFVKKLPTGQLPESGVPPAAITSTTAAIPPPPGVITSATAAVPPPPAAIPPPPLKPAPDASVQEEIAAIYAALTSLRGDLNNLTNSFYTVAADLQESRPDMPPPPAPGVRDVPTPTRAAPSVTASRKSEFPLQDVMERIVALEKRLKECCDEIGKSDGVVQDQINSFQDQLEYLMKQVNDLTQELSLGKMSPDLIKDLQGLMKLFETVQEMQQQLKQVHETALQLAEEKEDRQYNMNALLEQIELLKTIKLDREDMIEAMAEKADLRLLARKVSHDQFEVACDDLSRGLEDAIGKLNVQEALWQQALDDIQREIELKLDKMELSPLKDFFHTKLKQLQDNLKKIAAMRLEVEAAGTKRRLLRDVNCISCDAKVVMPMDAPSALPVSRPMPASLSMKPYLSYELDTIRKAQAANVTQRNMHDWENIDKQMGQQKQPQRPKSDTGKHICNRYCGGSHTVTTPAQRVARLGHFIKQWGPDVVPLSSGLAAGDDGRMYKVSTVEGANVGPDGATEICTPKKAKRSPPVHPSSELMTAECRCLERIDQ